MVSILPEYMKPLYIAMLNHYKEISKEIGKDENSLQVHTTKEEVSFLSLPPLSSLLLIYTYK